MRTFDDHSLEFWGDVFQACRLASVDVRFEDFIANPQRILQDFGMDDAVEIMESGFALAAQAGTHSCAFGASDHA